MSWAWVPLLLARLSVASAVAGGAAMLRRRGGATAGRWPLAEGPLVPFGAAVNGTTVAAASATAEALAPTMGPVGELLAAGGGPVNPEGTTFDVDLRSQLLQLGSHVSSRGRRRPTAPSMA
mmetsp:Transcript_21086/g.58446  ORF Transcript_21086/g.58446 Transcript_21086/m.58446 type:complete len:121 (-) Transcript_21086:147-509(-)